MRVPTKKARAGPTTLRISRGCTIYDFPGATETSADSAATPHQHYGGGCYPTKDGDGPPRVAQRGTCAQWRPARGPRSHAVGVDAPSHTTVEPQGDQERCGAPDITLATSVRISRVASCGPWRLRRPGNLRWVPLAATMSYGDIGAAALRLLPQATPPPVLPPCSDSSQQFPAAARATKGTRRTRAPARCSGPLFDAEAASSCRSTAFSATEAGSTAPTAPPVAAVGSMASDDEPAWQREATAVLARAPAAASPAPLPDVRAVPAPIAVRTSEASPVTPAPPRRSGGRQRRKARLARQGDAPGCYDRWASLDVDQTPSGVAVRGLDWPAVLHARCLMASWLGADWLTVVERNLAASRITWRARHGSATQRSAYMGGEDAMRRFLTATTAHDIVVVSSDA